MKENLGCLILGHHPADYGIYRNKIQNRYETMCDKCNQAIYIPESQLVQAPDMWGWMDATWKLISDAS